MEIKDEERIIGYCGYCKDPVYENEKFEYDEIENKYYHDFCYEQMNRYPEQCKK